MTEVKGPDGKLYEMTIVATGEVRDKDGNLVEIINATLEEEGDDQ